MTQRKEDELMESMLYAPFAAISIYAAFFMIVATVLTAIGGDDSNRQTKEGAKNSLKIWRRVIRLLGRFLLTRPRLLILIYGNRMWDDVDEFVDRLKSGSGADLEQMLEQMLAKYPLASETIVDRIRLILALGSLRGSDVGSSPYSYPKRK
jgi:hypothetical protein